MTHEGYWVAWRGNDKGKGRKAQILCREGWRLEPDVVEVRLFSARRLAQRAAGEWGKGRGIAGGMVMNLTDAVKVGWIED